MGKTFQPQFNLMPLPKVFVLMVYMMVIAEVGTASGFTVRVAGSGAGTDNTTCGDHPDRPCSTME